MDLEKAYDTIDRHGMLKMVRVHGVGGKFLKTVQSFYVDSWACVWVGNDVSEWFPVNVGLRQGASAQTGYCASRKKKVPFSMANTNTNNTNKK